MNELIRELSKDADLDWHKHWNDDETNRLEKFAELIVKECAKVLTQHGAYFSGDGEPYHYAASLIEEHFGVE